MIEADRRRSPRYQVWVPVRLRVGSEQAQAHLHDISRGGGRLTAERTWPPDTALELELPPLGATETVAVAARIVRVVDQSGDDAQGMAVRFTEVSANAEAWLDRVIGAQR
jgi:c-di-GMP-binding flagellar brake protein YcgR